MKKDLFIEYLRDRNVNFESLNCQKGIMVVTNPEYTQGRIEIDAKNTFMDIKDALKRTHYSPRVKECIIIHKRRDFFSDNTTTKFNFRFIVL